MWDSGDLDMNVYSLIKMEVKGIEDGLKELSLDKDPSTFDEISVQDEIESTCLVLKRTKRLSLGLRIRLGILFNVLYEILPKKKGLNKDWQYKGVSYKTIAEYIKGRFDYSASDVSGMRKLADIAQAFPPFLHTAMPWTFWRSAVTIDKLKAKDLNHLTNLWSNFQVERKEKEEKKKARASM